MAPSTTCIPKEWPKEVAELYEPVRVLGQGGFASVLLAKHKTSKAMVAMKVVAAAAATTTGQAQGSNNNNNNKGYAHREIDILKELSHCNIMNVLGYWDVDVDGSSTTGVVLIALSYARGPTVELLLQHGGALSNVFGRVVISQLVDAISYLHSHAVVHRDIKPDNIVVTGASSHDDQVWDNPTTTTTTNHNLTTEQQQQRPQREPPWTTLRTKWHVTLIDFGFARALTPHDVAKPSSSSLEIQRENDLGSSFQSNGSSHHKSSKKQRGGKVVSKQRMSSAGTNLNELGQLSFSSGMCLESSTRSSSKMRRSTSTGCLSQSISHRLKRQMSALGNRHFAAPEILNKIQHDSNSNSNTNTHHDITETLSEYTAEYGLLVDAYSLGHTIRYMMTGVPPHQRVEDAMAMNRTTIQRLGRWLATKTKTKRRPNNNNNKKPRKKRYRRIEDLPGEVQRLIAKLTEPSEQKRTSVRSARKYYPWINDVLPETGKEDEICYLSFTKPQEEEETTKQEEPPKEQTNQQEQEDTTKPQEV